MYVIAAGCPLIVCSQSLRVPHRERERERERERDMAGCCCAGGGGGVVGGEATYWLMLPHS